MKTFHRATAVVAAALLSASLTACSLIRIQNSSSDQETSSAQETDSTDTQSTAPTAGSGKDAPDGYQTVTTPSSMISFAVPENWQVFSGDDQNIPLPTGTQDPDGQGSQSLPAIELAAAAPNTNDGVPEHLFAIPVEQIGWEGQVRVCFARRARDGATDGYGRPRPAIRDGNIRHSRVRPDRSGCCIRQMGG